MKKLWPVVLIVVIAVIFFLNRSPKVAPQAPPIAAKTNSPASNTPPVIAAKTNSAPISNVVAKVSNPKPSRPAFLDNDVLKSARKAIEAGNYDVLDGVYAHFLQYIKDHPENVEEYAAALATEENEHILRAFARAMADAEVGLLENEKIIKAAIDLAKDTSFEQRQHIMLHLMSQIPHMNQEAYDAMVELSQKDPHSQVKTSAIAALADWMDSQPERTGALLAQIGDIFKTAKDEDVRNFAYQILALHKEALTRDLQLALADRFKSESDSFNCNLIATALSVASDDVRIDAINYAQSRFAKETDMEKRRNLLAQIVALSRQDSLPLLNKYSTGDSLLAQDARGYIGIVSSGQPYDAQEIFQLKATRDAENMPKPADPHP